jgi:hypothetical protein
MDVIMTLGELAAFLKAHPHDLSSATRKTHSSVPSGKRMALSSRLG